MRQARAHLGALWHNIRISPEIGRGCRIEALSAPLPGKPPEADRVSRPGDNGHSTCNPHSGSGGMISMKCTASRTRPPEKLPPNAVNSSAVSP